MRQGLKWALLVIAAAAIGLGLAVLFTVGAQAQGQALWASGYGYGGPAAASPSITSTVPYGYRGWGMGPGMMGGFFGRNANANVGPTTLDKAAEIATQFAQSFAPNVKVAEVMQFQYNFYAEIVEKDTGIGAQEILIDPTSGAVSPEFGPNMMWNTKYSPMGRGGMMGAMRGWLNQSGGQMTVTPDQARQDAQAYLDQAMPGAKVGDDITPFYGYYTLHTFKDDKVSGMLSVNGYTGQVWYHTWHGAFVDMKELGD
jgi:hypothetical protein